MIQELQKAFPTEQNHSVIPIKQILSIFSCQVSGLQHDI